MHFISGVCQKKEGLHEQQAFWHMVSHNKAVHKSILDLCHHQAMFVNLFIFY